MPSEKRKAPERFLRDDAQLERHRREDDGDVVDALMVRDEHVGLAAPHPLEPLHTHLDARRGQNQPGPRARAPVRCVPFAVDERGKNRQRAEHDRVNRNGGDEEKDRSPPMKWRDVQLPCRARRPASRSIGVGWALASMKRPKIILPAVVCSTLVTTTSMVLPIIDRALSTTTIVPSSR